MIKFNEVKVGDYLLAEYNGQIKEGEVINLNGDEKQVCVQTDEQEFWYEVTHLQPIPLSDEQMLKLAFTKQENPDGTIKYSKGSFRLVAPSKNDFSSIEMWYREDRRQHPDVHYVHQLQNQYHDMVKIPLTVQPM